MLYRFEGVVIKNAADTVCEALSALCPAPSTKQCAIYGVSQAPAAADIRHSLCYSQVEGAKI